ncbi:uncharacterized protein BDR25DRAFT_307827 [Lindgomyces ingoldianus]|uniref:Uncharacterized protein n=1 Tax=Lindgomyces ingoldianus TaxID=673940 RepID=A0ACB6Q912_9PLEO|nr:uncharacterized protein BDR25DRAFT_307827 [Lindgomyces ingoldianus]KAF2463389.1 hypothetical protein BDR25DRAFT_307827 [Lindgomyces ingoldianus]
MAYNSQYDPNMYQSGSPQPGYIQPSHSQNDYAQQPQPAYVNGRNPAFEYHAAEELLKSKKK